MMFILFSIPFKNLTVEQNLLMFVLLITSWLCCFCQISKGVDVGVIDILFILHLRVSILCMRCCQSPVRLYL